jgi:hypothetical protein
VVFSANLLNFFDDGDNYGLGGFSFIKNLPGDSSWFFKE